MFIAIDHNADLWRLWYGSIKAERGSEYDESAARGLGEIAPRLVIQCCKFKLVNNVGGKESGWSDSLIQAHSDMGFFCFHVQVLHDAGCHCYSCG